MSSSPSSPTLTFPHPDLSPITGQPTNTTLQLLQKQLYANARAIYSTRGGGANGHLSLVMPAADYLARAGQAFVIPIHPGDAPVHAAAATAAQITETNRQFAHDLNEFTLFTTVTEELKKQILIAVESRYLSMLEDPDFGFADITARDMLTHLKAEYGQITNEEIESNREKLSAAWSPDDPIEDLWLRIQESQRYAAAAGEPITDAAALRLTLPVFEQTGVFTSATEKWRDLPAAEWTLPNFKAHFTKANKERLRKLTAQTAGYHGANATTMMPTHPAPPTAPAATVPTTAAAITAPNAAVRTDNGLTMHYCWTHGLGKNRAHTSATCNNKAEGHVDAATADNMMGGNDRIATRTTRPRAKIL